MQSRATDSTIVSTGSAYTECLENIVQARFIGENKKEKKVLINISLEM